MRAGQHPGFDFLPRFRAEKTLAELLLKLIEALTPTGVAVTVDAQHDDSRHPTVSVDNLADPFRLQRFADATEERGLAHPHRRAWLAQ